MILQTKKKKIASDKTSLRCCFSRADPNSAMQHRPLAFAIRGFSQPHIPDNAYQRDSAPLCLLTHASFALSSLLFPEYQPQQHKLIFLFYYAQAPFCSACSILICSSMMCVSNHFLFTWLICPPSAAGRDSLLLCLLPTLLCCHRCACVFSFSFDNGQMTKTLNDMNQ